jgi:DNA invertase Pin-like site-specific DNA recombinase
MRVYGYARVSTKDQNLDIQIEAIQKYCKDRKFELQEIFAEKVSGKDMEGRARFKDMLELLEINPLEIGAVIVYKLDRLGRSISDLIKIITFFGKHNIQFISISDNIDTTTPNGRLLFHLMGSVAEFERELIQERTQAGILKARQSGKKFGRKRKAFNLSEVNKLIAMGVPKTRICEDMKFSKSFLNKKLHDARAKGEA